MNPFARFPFMRYILPFILGVILEIYIAIPPFFCFITLSFFIILVLIYSYSKKLRSQYKYRFVFGIALQFLWIILGMALISVSNQSHRNGYYGSIKDKKYLIVKLKEPLSRKAKSFKAQGEVVGVFDGQQTIASRGNLLLYFLNDTNIQYQIYCGDKILVKASEVEIPKPKNPGEFNYNRFLAFQNIHYQIFLKPGDWKPVSEGNNYELTRGVYRVRDMLLGVLNSYIESKTERGVAGALLFGYKDELDRDIVDAYARTGTLHVLAVSGMHVAILFLVVSFLFKPLQKKKAGAWSSAVLTILLIWFYSLLSGMSPSIVRASVMFTIIVLGKVLRDDISIYNNLFCSACLLLCYDPYFLFDAGFQLSYLAVLGIVYIQPKIAQLLIFKSWTGKQIWGLITVSVAAQIATFPISIYYFNQFPNYFIISNLVIIPITSLVMYAGIILIVVSKITPVAYVLGFGMNKLIAFADYLILKIQAWPVAVSEGLYITPLETLFLYALLCLLAIYFINARKKYLRLGILVLFIFCISIGIRKYNNSQHTLIVLNSVNGAFSLNYIEGKKNVLICDSVISGSAMKLKSHFQGFWNQNGVSDIIIKHPKEIYESISCRLDNNYLITATHSIYFADENTIIPIAKIINIDYLVLCRKSKISLQRLSEHFNFKHLVFDGSLKPWRKTKYISEAETLKLRYHDLPTDGALIITE